MSTIKDLLINKPQNKTVFSITEIGQLLDYGRTSRLSSALHYAITKGDLKRITRGLYVFDENYSRTELANKLRTPSYISLYTVLQEAGVTFQNHSSIYLVANRSDQLVVHDQRYIYRKIQDEILLNPLGLDIIGFVTKAILERAICDKIYLDGEEYFDNLRSVNWDLMRTLNTTLYHDKNIEKFINTNSL
jgi:predicted transcriptional regulator of viral defense system